MAKVLRRFVGPIVGFLAGGGLQVSGFEDMRVAITLWSIAGVWALIALFTWEPVHNFGSNIKRLRFTIKPVVNDTGNNRYSPSWLQEILSSDLERIVTSMKGKVTRWDFSGIDRPEPYFEVFMELVNTSVFTLRLAGVSGFAKVAGERCGIPPQVSPVSGIGRSSPVEIRVRQPITHETARMIKSAGDDNEEIHFDLREVIFEIENTTRGYEKHRPYIHGGEYDVVPIHVLKVERGIREELNIDVRKCSVRKTEKQGYFPLDVELTIKVPSLPVQLAKLQLCIADEVIDPITVNPPIPKMLEAKIESYMAKYEASYQQVLKGRITALTREEELKFIVGQERWESNEYKAHLLLLVGGEEVKSNEFKIDFSTRSL